MINKNRLIKLTQNLIRIDSQNPPGDESRIGLFVKNYLKNLGLKPKIYEFKKKRTNVIATLEGRNKKRALLLTPHLDTVPAGKDWQISPFSGRVFKGRIYGLGATDCKGNLACALETINSLVEDRLILDYNLIFAATADEECGSYLGLIPLLKKNILRPSQAVVLDAQNFSIIINQKGLLHLKIKIKGKRAHGAYPWRGINAIDLAIEIIKEIKNYKFFKTNNPYLRGPTINLGTIRGGDKVNIVADWCEFELDFRFLPNEPIQKLLEEIKRILKKQTKNFFSKQNSQIEIPEIEIEGLQKPYEINKNHPLINSLVKAMQKFKIKPKIKGSEGATVITFFQDKGIPAVALGFGEEGCAHCTDEYIKIESLYKGAQVLEEFLRNHKF